MKLLTTITAVLISVSAFSQNKLIYKGDGIITRGIDTLSLDEFKGMCKVEGIRKYQRVLRSPVSIPTVLRPHIMMSYNKAVKKSIIGESKKETIKYNRKKIGLALTSFTLASAITPRRRQQNFYEGRAWRTPGIIVLVCAGGFSINDFSTRLNHKYQSDVYFEQMVARYNKK
jgi:hypothetical protein